MNTFWYWFEVYGWASLGIGVLVGLVAFLFQWLIGLVDYEDQTSIKFKVLVSVLVGIAALFTWPLAILGILVICFLFLAIVWLIDSPNKPRLPRSHW
ncbi:MAG: hypothetical protein A2114_02335 [Candidatus Vogelbacteria bacterium GWA1_51_14]|uniref:DUF2516 family protein n=1 Tax=Candidatus Vogelbacteria bacterium GWA1_51_14 TaxID=1802435 RepID=A0A1G2Q960_9BACT|nr:MAG: hypothetical protein A2114_02335 [Candidatus Vogelbacteria bacterium GWA1_51_14]